MNSNLLSLSFQWLDVLASILGVCRAYVPTSSAFFAVPHIYFSAGNFPRQPPSRSDERTFSSPKLVRICAVVRAHSGRQFGSTRANVEGFAVEVDLRRRLDLLPFGHGHVAVPFLGDAKPLRRLREDPGFKKAAAPLETPRPAGKRQWLPIGIAALVTRGLPAARVLLLALRSERAR